MAETKLKPCPFCGGTTLTLYQDFMIQCYECKTVFAQPQTDKPKSMIEAWNRRADNE